MMMGLGEMHDPGFAIMGIEPTVPVSQRWSCTASVRVNQNDQKLPPFGEKKPSSGVKIC
jgi:hypothetical protein